MKAKTKVFFIAPALSMGGMERASVNTANGLQELGWEVVFLSLFKKEHFFKLNEEIKLLEPVGFNVSSLSCTSPFNGYVPKLKKATLIRFWYLINYMELSLQWP